MSNAAKLAGVPETTDAMYSFFLDRVRSNMHIILCFSPIGNKFRCVINRIILFCTYSFRVKITVQFIGSPTHVSRSLRNTCQYFARNLRVLVSPILEFVCLFILRKIKKNNVCNLVSLSMLENKVGGPDEVGRTQKTQMGQL